MRHEWFDEEGCRRIIGEEGEILLRSFGEGIYSQVLSTEGAAFAREILRLAEENRALRQRNDTQTESIGAYMSNAESDRARIAALEAENERYVEESGRHAKAFRLQLDRAVAAEAERDRALAEVERLRGALQQIDGGDNPSTDERQLRQWAYEALTLGR